MKTLFLVFRILRNLLVIGLVLVAIGLSVVRFWLLPQAPQWRETLQAELSTLIGAPVTISTLSAGMRGLTPDLTVRGLRIDSPTPNGPALTFNRLDVRLEVAESLRQRQPVISRIELGEARLRVVRQPDGSFTLAGLQSSGGAPPAWLLAEGELRFADIDLELQADANAAPVPLGRMQARLRNTGERHQLDARLDLPGKLGKAVRLSADIHGNPLTPQAWRGRGYVEVKKLREGAFAESLPLRLRSGEISLQTWGEWQAGALTQALSHVEFERPVFTWHRANNQPDGLMNLDKLSGWLRWQQQGSAWQLAVQHFQLAQGGKTWPETDFALALAPNADGSIGTLRAALSYLRLDDLLELAGAVPVLDEAQRETLRGLALHGEIRNARLIYQDAGRLGFCGDLLGLNFKANADWPGPNRVSGHVCGNDRDGVLDLNLAKTDINLPGVYPKPLAVDALNGHFAWHRSGGGALVLLPPQPPAVTPPLPPPDGTAPPMPETAETVEATPPKPNPFAGFAGSGWQIVGNQIHFSAPGMNLDGGFALTLPAADSPHLDMDAHLHNVDAARLRDYLPLALMAPAAAQWHGDAYVAGHISHADLRLRGRLADFPFSQGNGEFAATIDADGMELNFNPLWPHIYGMSARIAFLGAGMTIDTTGGLLGDLPLQTVQVTAPTLEGDAWLTILGGMDIELDKALKFLQQTPVRHIPQRLGKAFDASGPARLDLKLAVPLGAGETGVEGVLQLQHDALALKSASLKVQNIEGLLAFTETALAGQQITATALDAPVLLNVTQNNADIVLDAEGHGSVAALRKAFPHPLWQYADGSLNYRLNLQIPKSLDASSGPVRLEVTSDLQGVELKLPPPLVKAAPLKKDLALNLTLRRGGVNAWRVNYGHEGALRLLLSADGLESGEVFWNMRQTPVNWEPGLGLFIKTETLDAGAWRAVLQSLGGGEGGVLLPHALSIDIDTLAWNGENWDALRLFGKREGGEFAGFIDCRYGKGRFRLLDDEFSRVALHLDLEHLNLPKFADAKDDPPTRYALDPAKLPDLHVHARHLYRQGADLGDLELEAEQWTTGMNIKHLRLLADNHDLNAKGSWMRQDGQDRTRLDGHMQVRDLGALLALLGYDKEINRTPGESRFALNWSGAPPQFAAARLNGELNLKLGRGSVLQLEPGLGRALGILNLQTLRRLLLLDFSDLFGKGLAYDGMEGSFTLNSGQARTRGFVIDAVAADILVIGRVGLGEHDLEQTISVMPHPLASIPLAAPMLGGAAVGAIIDMAHRLVGAEDANLDSTNYAVTGTWDNPQIKRIEGSVSLDVVNRAWNDLKAMSGIERRPAP